MTATARHPAHSGGTKGWGRRTEVRVAAAGEGWPLPAAEGVSAGERRRSALILSPAERDSYMAGRALLREMLGEWQGVPPAAVALETDGLGKPRLAGRLSRPLSFSFSDTRGAAAAAVSGTAEVGIDVERARHLDSLDRVASRLFSEDELRLLDQAPGPERDRVFLAVWTAKEACGKVLGAGVGALPRLLRTSLEGAPRPPLGILLLSASAGGLMCVTFASPPGLVVSFASDRRLGAVRFSLGRRSPFDLDPFP